MHDKFNFDYSITNQDLIEAEHLKTRCSQQFRSNLILLIGIFPTVLLTVWRIKDHDFLMINIDYFKQFNSYKSNTDYITDAVWMFVPFLLLIGLTFPKYDPLARWRISKNYKQNFVNRESRSISISTDGIAIQSENFRESRKWQDFTKIVENKQIFLLFHSRNKEVVIIPKRIFNSEIELSTFRDLTHNIQS